MTPDSQTAIESAVAPAQDCRLKPIDLQPLSKRPFVSVITSNYNYAGFLNDAADSLFAQTYPDFEWIVCDDGSTDKSLEVLHSLARRDTRVQIISKKNGGQASGFNTGIAASTGELIFLLDSDDLFYPAKIEKMIAAHQAEPEAGLGLHRVQWVNHARRRQGKWPPAARMPSGWHGEWMLENGGVLPYMPSTSGLSIHRTVVGRVFPLPETRKLPYADQILTRLAPFLTSVLRRPEVLAEYRVHQNNAFIRKGTNAESIAWEITLCKSLWEAQAEFLRASTRGAELRLRPVEANAYMIYLRYLFARLSGADDQRLRYSALMMQMPKGSGILDLFWKTSLYLPAPIFAAAISVLNSPSKLKQFMSWLRGDA